MSGGYNQISTRLRDETAVRLGIMSKELHQGMAVKKADPEIYNNVYMEYFSGLSRHQLVQYAILYAFAHRRKFVSLLVRMATAGKRDFEEFSSMMDQSMDQLESDEDAVSANFINMFDSDKKLTKKEYNKLLRRFSAEEFIDPEPQGGFEY